MKVSVIIILFAFLAFANCEIVPRFPGVQPIIVPGAPNSDIPVATGTAVPLDIEDKIAIDPFTKDTSPPIVIVLTSSVPPVISREGFDVDNSILGGERDIKLTINSGAVGAVFSAGASAGQFVLSTPSNGNSFLEVQYDGRDGSTNLDTANGLGGVDLTTNSAQGFRVTALSDIDTEFTVTIYDSNNNVASAFAEVQGSVGEQSYTIEFSAFEDSLDFSSINAITFEVEGFENVDFVIVEFVTYGQIVNPPPVGTDCFSGVVLPCDTDYYRLQTFDDVQLGDYLTIEYYSIGENSHPDSTGRFFIVSSQFEDLQTELATNENIVDTLGALPGPNNYQYTCTDDCEIEIVWSNLHNTTYYIAVEGHGSGNLVYSICTAYNTVPVDRVFDKVLYPVFEDQRATIPPDDYVRHYHYYFVDVPESRYDEGIYLRVNISRVEPYPGVWLGLMFESLPIKAEDTGVIGSVDYDSEGEQSDNHIYPYCVDTTHRPEGSPFFSNPVRTDERIPCECFTEVTLFGEGPAYQLTCELVVDPCAMQYGTWYIAVELPQRSFPSNVNDTTGRVDYTLGATVEIPVIIDMDKNVTYKSYVEPNAYTHFRIRVPGDQVNLGDTKLHLHLSNVRNGFVDLYVHKGDGPLNTLAGGLEACSPANATCHTCDACNVVIEPCHFSAGNWYVSIAVSYDEAENKFLVWDEDRLPITYTLRAIWFNTPAPIPLIAGEPVSAYIGESLYDFYVIEVPPTIDTWLFVELYVKAEDTEVIISLLHGELPGGECYARPDFYCMTGDPYEKVWSTGPPTFYSDEPVQRESCSFMIQTCELEAGPLFISVYGHHTGYAAYGDTTFYQVPAHYTLWADFDVALALKDGVSYSESVFEKQYQHYYIRADRVYQGSWLTVEVTNIRHAIPQTLETYVNYQYLAGDCPCYDYLYNCTTVVCTEDDVFYGNPIEKPDILSCCTIVVPASDFRPGVWYIAVLGVNEDLFQYTTPIGYTLTVTIHDAPQFNPLILGQTFHGEVPQWNKTNEYTHFRLGTAAIPSNDLVIKVTFVQNCEFLGKQDDIYDSISVFLNKGAPANHYLGGWDFTCTASVSSQSYCYIVVPDCLFDGDDYFVAIKGDYSADFVGRFTIRAFTDEVRDIELTDGVPYYARVSEGRYKHFFISTTAEEDEYLAIDIYTNQDQSSIAAYLNKDARAGDGVCYQNIDLCFPLSTMCYWQILACELEPGRYYISVYGIIKQFYDNSVEFTISASHKPVAIQLFNGEPTTGHIWQTGRVQHYYFELDEVPPGGYLLFSIDNVKHGQVTVYGQKDYLAGRCPCFIYENTCTAASPNIFGNHEWCEIAIPTCQLEVGTYYFSVWLDYVSTTFIPLVFETPVGFIVEADLILPRFVRPTVVVGADASFIEYFQTVANNRYIHYGFGWTTEDFEAGYHLIVEVTNVHDGALFVYYNPLTPGDSYDDCHLAQICTSGLGAGSQCIWQLPYCLVRPQGNDTLHYVSVEGLTGRLQAQYNILLYKQPVPSVTANDAFTLDTPLNSSFFPIGTELNITHPKANEPNGWTQFIKLSNVPSHSDVGRGRMLELFFYRIQNNPNQPISFNVYVNPKRPAGAHGCCGDKASIGSCQEAPCSHTADTTVSINNGPDEFSHTCTFTENGNGHVSTDPFFGQRCTVRVWPCEFNKYCNEETLDWWVSVVPLTAVEPSSFGPGLTYSFQWRERSIRLTETNTEDSISLNEFINTYEFTREYVSVSSTTESEGWLSFYVDFNEPRSRFSVQTLFTQGSGVVYINGDEFAADTEDCHIYECSSIESCEDTSRFQVTECQSQYYQRYYITVRNTGVVDSELKVQFRLVAVIFPEVVEIPSHPTQASPYSTQSGPSINGIPGIEGSNYDFYYLIIDDDDLDNHNSWVVDVTRPVGTDSGELDVYIRFGAEPGRYYSSEDPEAVEGCGSWQYSCSLPAVSSRCTFQIPHCQLIEGYWYIAIHNPVFTLLSTLTDLPEYILTTFISNTPVPILLDQQVISTVESTVGLLQHFSVNITADDLDFDPRDSLIGYWTRYLRFQLDGLDGAVNFYVNYDALAGPVEPHSCLYNFNSVECTTGSCFIDVLPCSLGQSLITGVYYISVQQVVPTDFALLVRVYRNDYLPIPLTETISGTGHRFGTTDILYRYTVTEAELTANGDGDGNYRYVISEPVLSDDIDDHEYIIFNITASPLTDADADLHLEIWRDDCTRYSCDLSGPDSWCTIDALGLAPATAKNGRWFIRVENVDAVPFTLYYYHNQTTIQTILDRQTITEIIYPYEYQEYFYEAKDVGQGATLTVQVCAICGDVQAFIRPDLPAGPYDLFHPETVSAVDTCEATGPVDTTFVEENNCCVLFLDTCEYQQRGYYVGIRGVDMVYPGEANPHLYLPIKYTIEPFQTTLNVTALTFSECARTVTYYHPWTNVPVQFAFDLETVNVGSFLRVSLRVPDNYSPDDGSATLTINVNSTVGYSSGCDPEDRYLTCSTSFGTCSVIIDYYCYISKYDSSRYYIWADAPRGSEVLVERWDPTIAIIQPNIEYYGTINAPDLEDWNLPFRPNFQIYRFDLDPKGDENYYEKFFATVYLRDFNNGLVSAIVSTGQNPYFEDSCPDNSPSFSLTCSDELSEFFNCIIPITYKDLYSIAINGILPKTFWIVVTGLAQDCELHSIQYTLEVKTNWLITYFPVDETICNTVHQGEHNFHRLQPRQVEYPQQSILKIAITDVDYDSALSLHINPNGLLAVKGSSMYSEYSDIENEIHLDFFCGYEDLYLSVFGEVEGEDEFTIDYRMSVSKEKVHIKEVFDDSIYYADDDDDDACPHEHDFYFFRTAQPLGHHRGAFFRALVDSEFPTTVYVSKKNIAWDSCEGTIQGDNDPSLTGTTSVNVYDFDFADGLYYITVVSEGPYYLYTDIRDDAKNLTLGEVFRDGLEPGEYQVYLLQICKDWFEADDRLVIEITDVQGGHVAGWIYHDANPIPGSGFTGTPRYYTDAVAYFDTAASGYDYLLVKHSDLQDGYYHIVIRTAPPEGSPSANLNKYVTYRLFPYLIDFNIDPVEILANSVLNDVVDYYTINRINLEAVKYANYYHFMPLMEDEGFFEGISHAVVRLKNVRGGLLHMKVALDHLAISEYAYVDGEVYGITVYSPGVNDIEWRMQSSRYSMTLRNVFDTQPSSYQEGCDSGYADYCVSMSVDEDLSIYNRDTSAAIWLPSCYLMWYEVYIAVEPIRQYYEDHSIEYELSVEQYKDYVLIQPDTHQISEFTLNNWDFDFYYSISPEPKSMRWRVVVTNGEGVLVTVRNHRCPLQATWIKEVWCDAAYFDRPWMCDIEIPTRAAHPGDNAFFISVYGKNATYSIAFWRGRENCHEFTGAGRNEGLDFCAGLVPYATWRWDHYHNLDQEANCFFNRLYDHFKCQPCWNGVSLECNATLQAFACYESFKRCDEDGFYTGTCRDACNAVVYECVNWFETVDLEHYNCSSHRYLDSNAGVCTGGNEFSSFNPGTQHFLGEEPNLILFKSSPTAVDSSSPASTLTFSAVLYLVALLIVFVL